MRLSDIGEFGLIERLVREFGIEYPPARGAAPPHGLLVGLGDDAVVSARRDGAVIWTTDTMVAGEHFLPKRGAWADTGWKSLASNVSDIAAMGGTPHLALVTLTLPAEFCVDDAVDLYRGLHECAQAYEVTLGGGDIVRSPVFSITVALSGWTATSATGAPAVLRRDAARLGDVVSVTGTLGDCAGGVRLLLDDSSFDGDDERRLRDAMLRPRPSVVCGQAAVQAGLRCGIDVSDGLAQDLGHVAAASGVSISLDASRVPVSDALSSVFGTQALELALNGGEDYELVAVGPRAAVEAYALKADKQVSVIGEVVEGNSGVVVMDGQGNAISLGRRGWDHFATR